MAGPGGASEQLTSGAGLAGGLARAQELPGSSALSSHEGSVLSGAVPSLPTAPPLLRA